MLSVERARVGTQKNSILKGLFPSRLARKNTIKNKTARIQKRGEKMLSTNPPATAANPVALSELISLKADHNLGTISARKIAAIPQSTFLK